MARSTAIISDAKTETLLPISKEKVAPDSIVYTDCWPGYNALDLSEFGGERINHSELFADRQNHIDGTWNFLNQAKRKYAEVQRHQTREFLLVFDGAGVALQWGQPPSLAKAA